MASKQRRLAITDKERKTIRQYAQANEALRQSDIANWASHEFKRTITQSMVSKILTRKYLHLDKVSIPRGVSGISRIINADHPILERALYEWVLSMEGLKIPVNGDMIRGAAHSLWDRMPDFQGLKEPKWSCGWLEGFKKRYRIKKYKQSGESASADISGSGEEIARIQEVIKSYASKDVYNTDETGLFWLQLPDTTLATKPQFGGKKMKNRITILPTASATGHKLDLWIISHFANPRPFGRNCRNIQGLPFVWKHNKKGWMTAVIFIEYLRWFDTQMAGRKVLLLVDGFSAHKSGI
jgi:hypothetical protein